MHVPCTSCHAHAVSESGEGGRAAIFPARTKPSALSPHELPVSQAFNNPTRRRTMLSLGEDYSADLDGHCSIECADVPPSLEHLPEDVLLALMHRLDGESLACFGRTAKPVHAASSHIPPLVFASRGRLVVFRGSPPRGSRRNTI